MVVAKRPFFLLVMPFASGTWGEGAAMVVET